MRENTKVWTQKRAWTQKEYKVNERKREIVISNSKIKEIFYSILLLQPTSGKSIRPWPAIFFLSLFTLRLPPASIWRESLQISLDNTLMEQIAYWDNTVVV